MTIVVLDGHSLNPGDLSWAPLSALGALTVHERTPAELIIPRIGQAEAIFTNKTPITRQTMAACPSLKFIGVLATGYNVVDVAAANALGITVCNVPAYSTEATAQMAIALLLEICSRVGQHSRAVREGRWSSSPDFCFWEHPLIELKDKTLGVIGFGRIGQAVARVAAALGMRVLAHSRSRNPQLESEQVRYAALDELYREADVISLHVPLFPETEGMINRESIARMKDGVIIINNSRGPVIVEQDLADALHSGKVYAAGLDVVSREPIDPDNPLLTARNCFITPHISWAPRETRQRLMDIAVSNLQQFIAGKPINVVSG